MLNELCLSLSNLIRLCEISKFQTNKVVGISNSTSVFHRDYNFFLISYFMLIDNQQ